MNESRTMDQLDRMISFENGELSEDETFKLLTELRDSGMLSHLQGFYGRAARSLGLIYRPHRALTRNPDMTEYRPMDQFERMIAFENGELSEDETFELLTELCDSGMLSHLQGFYGRAARSLGLI